jgi:hypothetical protein
LADALGVGGTFEVVGVAVFGEPSRLALALAGLAAGRLGAKKLAAAIAWIRPEEIVAMETLGERGAIRHRGEEDAAGGKEWRTEEREAVARKKT